MTNELKLSKSFYNKKVILKASKDYDKLASIQIKELDEYIICIFNDCKTDLELVLKEFCNYLIALTVKEKGYMGK
jgi:hypothetical protein